jgi:alkylation response protein AidB-like acyl-CoA dehydrogenase
MHERATLGAGMQITFRRQFDRLVELSHTIQRNGQPAAEDPVMRQKLAQSFVDIEIMRLNQMRAVTRINQNGVPGPEGSIQKIFWTELNQRFQQVAAELLGPYVQLTKANGHAIDDGAWAYSFLRARGNTIEAGTSEIQRNIVGHFVLGLPKSY